MDFGEAIRAAKAGKKIARAGWNGEGMFVYLSGGGQLVTPFLGVPSDLTCLVQSEPYFVMYTAQGRWQPGWLASQADMLAEDWEVV